MARSTGSGAPSSRSDRFAFNSPPRSRIVVFRLVNLRKRTSIAGRGARGRSALYSSAKIWLKGSGTTGEPSTGSNRPGDSAEAAALL